MPFSYITNNLCLVTLSAEQTWFDRKQTLSQSMVIFPKSFYEKKSIWFPSLSALHHLKNAKSCKFTCPMFIELPWSFGPRLALMWIFLNLYTELYFLAFHLDLSQYHLDIFPHLLLMAIFGIKVRYTDNEHIQLLIVTGCLILLHNPYFFA